jgi:biopolymer transport protein ExbB/TolQ
VVEVTSASIEEGDGGKLLKLEWKLREVENWGEIEAGSVARPRLRDISDLEGCTFEISLNGEQVGRSNSLNFREAVGDFRIGKGEVQSAAVILEENPLFRDISGEFSGMLNREPALGIAEITARADTVHPPVRKAVRGTWQDIYGAVSDGGAIAWLLVFVLFWGLASIYFHLRRLYRDEFENLAEVSGRIREAQSLDAAEKASTECPVFSGMELRDAVDEYRRRTGPYAGHGRPVRRAQEMERLRNRLYSGLNIKLSRLLEAKGRALSWVIPVEMIRCLGILAPMVGLLGTVIGISDSFGGLYIKIKTIVTGQNRAVLENLSGGIHLALNTTVFGLIVGISFLFFYYLIQFRRNRIAARVDEAVENAINKVVEENYIQLDDRGEKKAPGEGGISGEPMRAAAGGGM